jgi:predicted permease
MQEEMAEHLARSTERLVARGLSPEEARREALREFGDVALLQEEGRLAWGRQLLALSEFRFAQRRLRRAPAFSGAVVLVLALAVGTATAVFSLVSRILLDPLPYPDPDRLVRITHTVSDAGPATVDLSDAMLLLYQGEASAFGSVAAWRFDDGDLGPSAANQSAVRIRGARATANFFDVVGVRPALGRTFAPGDDRPGGPRVVVLSHRIWQQRLHGDPDAIGRQIDVNDVPRTIIGIMPPGFAYPAREVELWLPLALDPARTRPATLNLVGIGRLDLGVTGEAARADLARALTHLGDYVPADAAATWREARITPHVQSLRDSIVGPASRLLWFVFGSVLVVLMVACINIAGLLLVRAERAQMELAVRMALGSGFAGLLALTLSEALLLSVLGGGAGVLLAVTAKRVVLSTGVALSLPRLEEVEVDASVLLFALGITVFCALFVSLLPLLNARRAPIAQVLRRAGSGRAGGRAPQRLRDALVVAQIALAVVLVASAGLMTRSFLRLNEVHPGFDADHVVTSRVLLPFASYSGPTARLNFFKALVRGAEAIPGTRDVGLTNWVPLSGDHSDVAIEVEGNQPPGDAAGAEHPVAHADEGYFRTLRIPVIRGRTFGPQDAARPLDEAIVNHSFAERYWPGASPLGKRVRPLGGRWYTVVGEVGDVHYDRLEEPAKAMVYLPIIVGQAGGEVSLPSALSLVVRTDAGEGEALAALRETLRALDPDIPAYDESSLNELVRDASALARSLVVLLAIAGVVTSLLGAVGLYAMMAYSVSIRRREIGIRMALGARPADLSRALSLEGLRLAGIGIVLGTTCTLALSRVVRGLLYGVGPADPMALTATAVVLLAVAFIASWIPARRAAAVHPAESLQSQ